MVCRRKVDKSKSDCRVLGAVDVEDIVLVKEKNYSAPKESVTGLKRVSDSYYIFNPETYDWELVEKAVPLALPEAFSYMDCFLYRDHNGRWLIVDAVTGIDITGDYSKENALLALANWFSTPDHKDLFAELISEYPPSLRYESCGPQSKLKRVNNFDGGLQK